MGGIFRPHTNDGHLFNTFDDYVNYIRFIIIVDEDKIYYWRLSYRLLK